MTASTAEGKMLNNDLTASDIAKYFIAKASNLDENDLTNLKLQKLLYFAQGEFLAKKRRVLFPDKIEAWDLGPVVRRVYDEYKTCGAFPITVFDSKEEAQTLPNEVTNFLDYIWDKWGKYSARYLVNETHKEKSPWKQTYEKSKDKTINPKLLLEYFQKNS